jgi:YD repeat-containing protein
MNYRKYFGIVFSIFLLISLPGCTAKKKTDLQNLSLQGKVKQMIELQYYAEERFGKIEKGDAYRQDGWDMVMDFNERGYYSKIIYVDSYGKDVGYTDYLYNDKNELFAEQNYNAEGGFSNKHDYSYDEKGRVTQVVILNSIDGLRGSKLINYDDKDNQVTESDYNARGKLLRKEVRKLDKSGLPVETRIYNAEDNLVNYRKEKFDEKGLRNELTVFSPDEKVLMKVFFKYDQKENLILQEGVDDLGQAFLPMRYEYEFDKQGNWIKRVEYVGSKPTFVLERQFEYYE